MEKINVVITGATGMIGESILDQCLKHDYIENVLIINRHSAGYLHPRLKEIILSDLSEASTIKEALQDYNACFFCVGVSSLGMDETTYTRLTYRLTMDFARLLSEINPSMTFCYISGAGTNSSEKGRTMWARVKGKTENDLLKLPFKNAYNFRPSGLIPYLKIKPTQTYQSVKYLKWLMILLRPIFPNSIIKLEDFSNAMINSALFGYNKNILESIDIKKLTEYSKS